jgi:hypothetical protein
VFFAKMAAKGFATKTLRRESFKIAVELGLAKRLYEVLNYLVYVD